MHIFHAMRIGGYILHTTLYGSAAGCTCRSLHIFLQHCSSGWGVIKFLIIKWGGGHKNIAKVLSEIYDPSIPKKTVAPLKSTK